MDETHHLSDTNVQKIMAEFSPDAESKIVSTRIRVARNLNFFPLNPSGTKESRLDIPNLMEEVFSKLKGDLAGTFYRHSSMTPEETQRLIDEHILFRGKDRMQAASGYHEFWPFGRGVFISYDRHLVCWVNEGDHICIISMEQGHNVKNGFSRLFDAVSWIEKNIRDITGHSNVFLTDSSLGVITCCPSNLGTGLRASVHIRLPRLLKTVGLKGIQDIVLSMNCEARGTHGEHTDAIDIVDISNQRRLGIPEYVLVQDMINCTNKLVIMEESTMIDN